MDKRSRMNADSRLDAGLAPESNRRLIEVQLERSSEEHV